MEKKEYKIGDVFCFDHSINLRVDKITKDCKGCYFISKECNYDCMDDEVENETGGCLSSDRSDKTSVIFKKVDY